MRLPKEESIHYPILLFIVMIGLSVTRAPAMVLLGIGRNSIWIFAPCLPLILLSVWLYHRVVITEGTSFMLTARRIGGVFTEKAFYLLYALLFLGGAVYYIYLSGDFISKTLLNGSLRYFVLIETAMAAIVGSFPLRTMARYAHIMIIFVFPFFFIISLFPLMNLNWGWMMPLIAPSEMSDPLHSFSSAMLVFLPLAALGLIQDKQKVNLSRLSLALGCSLVALITTYFMAAGIATFGIIRAKQIVYLTYSLLNTVRIENFVLERIVFLWVLYWKFLQFVGTAFLLRCAARSFAGVLGLRVNAYVLAAVTVMIAAAEWFGTSPFLARALALPLGLATCAITLLTPLLLYAGVKLRRKPL
ncbi:hypothetical protein B5M42_017720 [Paenibacillus athensensis]|uniref:GerAB/ArcD/ProY family transporter n=1 Tax=Paenibacillus athensensis TaxID=1967502 RepID=UPI001430358D|nr:GerAB/ArcD/ProY family transporter [Paenibacillus athensensis]MCD1260642.1 hypothetical protein [Paenibacillus athensensis]